MIVYFKGIKKTNCVFYYFKIKKMQVRFLLFFLLISEFSSLGAEDLKSVLKDAYNFFPDIKKVKLNLKTQKKIYKFQKLIFYLQLNFQRLKPEI